MNDNKEIKKIKTAVYVRISTDEKRQKYSLGEQEERIINYCNYKRQAQDIDYEIVEIFREDKSAKNMKDRPKFLKMLDMVKKGKIEHIIIFKLDRMTRSLRDLEEILTLIEEYDCGLTSVSEDIDTKGIMGRFCIRLMILVAQLEIEQNSFRTTIGMEGAAKAGVISGQPPLGYKKDVDNKDPKLKKRLIIDEETAPVIRHIFDLYTKGYSYYFIAQKLIEENNTLRKWKDTAIQKIINNKIYCGDIEHRKSLDDKETIIYENVVPAIISKDIFKECQRMIEKNKESFGSTLEYMYGKTLYCSKCGKMLHNSTQNAKNIKYYECSCYGNINENKLEKVLMEKMSNIFEFNMTLTYNSMVTDDNILEQVLNNIDIDVPDERLKARKEELRDKIDDLVVYQIKNNDNTKNKLWTSMSYEEKKEFISTYIDAIYINKIKGKTQHDYKLKIKNIIFKKSKINKLFELRANNLIEAYGRNDSNIWSLTEIDNKEELDNYLERLRKRYKIKIAEINVRNDNTESKAQKEEYDDIIEKIVSSNKCFKTIKYKGKELKDKFLKEKHIHIVLDE